METAKLKRTWHHCPSGQIPMVFDSGFHCMAVPGRPLRGLGVALTGTHVALAAVAIGVTAALLTRRQRTGAISGTRSRRRRRSLAGIDQPTDFGTIIWIGRARKDGKVPVTYGFRSSGARINKLLTEGEVAKEIARAATDKSLEIRRKK